MYRSDDKYITMDSCNELISERLDNLYGELKTAQEKRKFFKQFYKLEKGDKKAKTWRHFQHSCKGTAQQEFAVETFKLNGASGKILEILIEGVMDLSYFDQWAENEWNKLYGYNLDEMCIDCWEPSKKRYVAYDGHVGDKCEECYKKRNVIARR